MDLLNKAAYSLDAFKSEIDGHIVLVINTDSDGPENIYGPLLRVVLNDDFDEPIYDNTQGTIK